MTNYVFTDTLDFNITTPASVADAIAAWSSYKGKHTQAEFKTNLSALAHKLGAEYVAALPADWNAGSDDQKGVMPQEQQNIVRVYANPYGGPYNGKDAHGQWFSPQTKFWEKELPLPPSVYYHGRNPDGSPAGLPEFTGPTIRRGADAKGVWYDVALDVKNSEAARRLAATTSDRIRASAGVVPATKRINKLTGHIDSWMNGEVSIFDADPAVGRVPVNDYAVGTHIKALYQKAGLTLPNKAGAMDLGKLAEFVMTLLSFGDSSANGSAAPNDFNALNQNAPAALPSTPAAQATTTSTAIAPEKSRDAHDHTHDHADGARHSHPHGHDAGLHIHDHNHTAPALETTPPLVADTPMKKDEKAMANQVDEQKATTVAAPVVPVIDDSMKAMRTVLTRHVTTAAEAWAGMLLKAGKMFPAEKGTAVQLYTTLALSDDSMKAEGGESETLASFKLMWEQREPHIAAGDLDPTNLKAAGGDATATDGAPSADRVKALMNQTPLGRTIAKEGAAHARA